MYIVYLVFAVVLFIVATIGWAAFSFAPWVPMKSRDLARVFALANLKPGELFYDLGCGDGRVALAAAKKYKAKAIGLELALPLLWLCKLRRLFVRHANVKFKWKNLFREDLSRADVVYFFGLPSTIQNRLRQKLERELKSGARVVSYVFEIHGWQPAAVSKQANKDLPIYLYKR
jgi:SAM-dependent methyltransferase